MSTRLALRTTVNLLALGALTGTLLAQNQRKGPPTEPAGAMVELPRSQTLRHIEGDATPLQLALGPRGPAGSLIRNQTVDGEFALPVVISEGFESGSLDPARWTTYSSLPEGQIRVTGDWGTAGGDYALFMDRSTSGAYNLNEAILNVDMTTALSAVLVFSERSQGDEIHYFPSVDYTGSVNADGVSISDDGVRWHRVFQGASNSYWIQRRVDLAAEAAAAGMTLGANFQIKFQQYDNFAASSDGRAYDEIGFEGSGIDVDTYEVGLAAGQQLQVRLDLLPISTYPEVPNDVLAYVKVELRNRVLAEGASTDPGGSVLLQAIDGQGRLSGVGFPTSTMQITVVNANGEMGPYRLDVALNETSEREAPGGSSNDSVGLAESLDASFVPLHEAVTSSSAGRTAQRAAVRGQGGQKRVYYEDFESGELGPRWSTNSSTPTGRIRVTDEAGAASGSFALVLDNDPPFAPAGSFYEEFLDGAQNDLSGHALRLTPNAQGGYDVDASAATYITPAADVGAWDDSTHERDLGFTIDWPGQGSVSQITISSNGRIGPVGQIDSDYSQSVFELLQAPQVCALWDDLNPSAQGGVYFDTAPGLAVVSWDGVPQYYADGSNTFQIQIHDTGVIDIVWVHVEADAIVGFSDGQSGDGESIPSRDLTASIPFSTISGGGGGGGANVNAAVWSVDLTGLGNPQLHFRHMSFADEDDYPLDGVAISGDGVGWSPVVTLWGDYYWADYYVDLSAAAATAGIRLDANILIRFQQSDNAAFPLDGRGFDDIEILANDDDYYRIRLTRGETVGVYGTGYGLRVSLEDAAGDQLADSVEQPIQNGSFESTYGWTSRYDAAPSFGPGRWGGGIFGDTYLRPAAGSVIWGHSFSSSPTAAGAPYTFELSQTVTIPSAVPGPLTWFEALFWNFTNGSQVATQPRTHSVELRDPGTGAVLATLHSFATGTAATAPTGATGWVQRSVDISAFAGRRVDLVFRQVVPEAETGSGSFYLDGVRIDGINDVADAFVPLYTATRTGDYYVRVSGSGDYDVLVLRNAEFGLEDNDSYGDAQPLRGLQVAGRRWVVGHAGTLALDPDYYAIEGTVGRTLVAEVYAPATGAGPYDNRFIPEIRLHDATGNLIARATGSGRDSTSVRLEHEFVSSGAYYVSVNTMLEIYAAEDFESGSFGPQWHATSSTPDGLNEVSSYRALSGIYYLVMSKRTSDGVYNLNTADWTIDLTGAESPVLRFLHDSINDEGHTQDGVFVSDNGGQSFRKVFMPPSGNVAARYNEVNLGGRGLTFGPDFIIRFQQYDDLPLNSDGRGWDDISVFSAMPAGEYVLSIKGDG